MESEANVYNPLELMLIDESAEPAALSLSLLKSITNNFSDYLRIGSGGFAVVYKGKLENGTVAVKRLLTQTLDMNETKFHQEVDSLMRVKHKNVVRFMGYCSDTQGKVWNLQGKNIVAEERERFLCFEFLPQGSLDKYISKATHGLEWMECYKIIKGICEGLHYLHHGDQKKIVHCDLKPANILLDHDMNPKITDFGLSRLFDDNQTRAMTSNVIGSMGYMAPEYIDGQITLKSDIYSLGVIIIEILTGQKGSRQIENVLGSWNSHVETSPEDTRLEHIRECAELAIQCADFDPDKRPDTQHIINRLAEMERVYDFLNTDSAATNPKLKLEIMGRLNSIPSTTGANGFPVLVRVTAPLQYTERTRAGLDLVAMVGISKSMSSDCLESMKQAMMFVINNLGRDDRLSVVSLNNGTDCLMELRSMTDMNRKIARYVVRSKLRAGYTNMGLALNKAAEILRQRGAEERSNRVGRIIILSDESDTTEIDEIEFPTETFGLGAEHSHAALNYIARKTRGVYSYVTQDLEKTKDALAQSLGGLMSVTAMDVQVNLQTLDGVTIKHIASGWYPMSISFDKMSGTIQVADLYAGEQKNFIIFLDVPEGEQKRFMTVSGSYRNPKISKEAPIHLDDIELVVTRRAEAVTTAPDGSVCPDVSAELIRLRLMGHVGAILNGDDDTMASDRLDIFFGCSCLPWLQRLCQHVGCCRHSCNQQQKVEVITPMIIDGLQRFWEQVKGSEDGQSAAQSAMLALDEDVANIQEEMFIFSWMSSQEMQRATTKGLPTKSSAFRVKAMEEMMEKVYAGQKGLCDRVKVEIMGRVKSIPSTMEDNKFCVLVRVTAPLLYTERLRAGLDLVVVLDISDIMNLYDLERMKQGMMFVIDNLGPDDRLSVVRSLNNEVQRLMELSFMTDLNGKLIARHEVHMLQPGGNPNGTLAMEEAAEILRQRGPEERSNRVGRIMFLSDRDHAIEINKISHKFPTETFGLGTYHSHIALGSIAQKTRGLYSYVNRGLEKIMDALAHSLGGLMSVTAMDVQLNLQTLKGVTIEHIASGWHPMRIRFDKMSGTIQVADLYAGEQKNFIILLNVPEGEQNRFMTVNGSYRNPKISKEAPIQLDNIELTVTRRAEAVTTASNGMVCPDVSAELIRLRLMEHVGAILDGDDETMAYNRLQSLWKEVKGSEDWQSASQSAMLALDEDVANIRKGTPTFLRSWLTSHMLQRATTKESPTKSCAFRVKAMEEMIEKVDAVRKRLEAEYVRRKLVHFNGSFAFTNENLLGTSAKIMRRSTYMEVYKGTLKDGSLMVFKRLWEKFTKGNNEFEAEAALLGKIRHPNLLVPRACSLLPYGDKLLVFDYMRKGSLSTFLHARGRNTPVYWATRMIIAKGMARGLAYLHDDKRIIHGNLTANNVLLDEQGNPKIADIDLTLMMTADGSSNMLAAMGKEGYRAPELSKEEEEANAKTDVYSLGVIILELLTGKSPAYRINGLDLPQWVASIINEDSTSKVVDFDLELRRDPAGGTFVDDLTDTLKLALRCVHPSPNKRPEAREVLRQLEQISPGSDGGSRQSEKGHVPLSAGGGDRSFSGARIALESIALQIGIECTIPIWAESFDDMGRKLERFDGPLQLKVEDVVPEDIMGQSIYGKVYKVWLSDGSLVAVKVAREEISKDQMAFGAEAALLGKIRHPNLLALRAYLGPKGENLLFFDYMPNGSLSTFLHYARAPNTLVDWATRMTIAKGMAHGLAYLHDYMSIIHGYLTASNVLLDEQYNPKIADFSQSSLITADANSNVLSDAGALGYRAPELEKLEEANAKTDVYSMGVIFLQLLTGKSAANRANGMDLPQWVASIVEEWNSKVYPELMRDAAAGTVGDELTDTLKLALQCVDPSPSVRPEAREVLRQLEQISPLSDGGFRKSEEGHVPLPAEGDDRSAESGGDMGGKLVHFDEPLAFTADALLGATRVIMGKSTYGTVYKVTLEDGSLLALKLLRQKITKGDEMFEAEAAVLGKIRHPNLLALRAYNLELKPEGRKVLLFDYMPKGSLYAYLNAPGKRWGRRMRIAMGTARGLAYLHDDMAIIHGNLTSRTVLLDAKYNPKIADFGLFRLMTADANCSVLSAAYVLGYRAPELSKEEEANTKTDVYSLGIIILELLMRKPATTRTNGMDLPRWVASIINENRTHIRRMYHFELELRDGLPDALKLALQCVDPSPSVRPEARGVLRQLELISPAGEEDCSAKQVESVANMGGKKVVHFDEPLVFTNLRMSEKIGKSTYGTVYKVMLNDGSLVAVKVLRQKITKGDKMFEAEAAVLGKIRHLNLMALRAYHLELKPEGMKVLVFDYMPMGTLYDYMRVSRMEWEPLLMIAMGTARGLAYLHDDMAIIHFNLTTRNVLLDEECNPKIADFSLFRLMTADANCSELSAAYVLGYRAPELSKEEEANTKTDVYSLGVIILELLTGKSAANRFNGMDLPQWVASTFNERTISVFDFELTGHIKKTVRSGCATIYGATEEDLTTTLKLALCCVHPSPNKRPEAREVLRQLEQISQEFWLRDWRVADQSGVLAISQEYIE